MKRVLCIWLPNWPIQRFATWPELEKQQAAGSRQRAEGSLAAGLARRVPSPCRQAGTSAVASDPAADRHALEQLAEWCRQFSPVVGLEDSATPESLLLDVTDLGSLFGGETLLAEKVLHAFAERGLAVRVAIADTIGAAWAAAHFGRGKTEEGRQKGEGERKKASSVHSSSLISHPLSLISHPSSLILHHSAFLAPMPIEALRLPKETVELLHQLGIHRIEQLERLPRQDLACRFGSRLVDRWDQATGALTEPIPALPMPPQLEAEQSLEYPTARQETVELLLEQLIGRLARTLVRCGRGVMRLRCRLDCQSAGPVDLSVGLFEATASARHLFQLLCMQLERLVLPGPVSAIRVEAAVTAVFRRRQEELFSDDRLRQHLRHLADLIDRLSSQLGCRSVVRARLIPDAQPELAYSYNPLAAHGTRPIRHVGRLKADLPLRPLRLVCRPVSLAVVSIVPDGPPLRFCLKNHQHQVVHAWGPERIETGWWRGRAVARDYYRIETVTGERFWVFRDLQDGQWFVQGTFE